MREEDYPVDMYTARSLFLSSHALERVDTILLASSGRLWELLQGHTPALREPVRLPWPAEEVRMSPFGQAVLVIVAFVDRASLLEPVEIKRAIHRVLRLLYGDAFGEGYTLPKDFHTSALGRLVDEAHRGIYGYKAFLGSTKAAREVGVSRQSVYDRVADGKLLAIHWPDGVQRVLRADIEAWKAERAQQRKSSR